MTCGVDSVTRCHIYFVPWHPMPNQEMRGMEFFEEAGISLESLLRVEEHVQKGHRIRVVRSSAFPFIPQSPVRHWIDMLFPSRAGTRGYATARNSSGAPIN